MSLVTVYDRLIEPNGKPASWKQLIFEPISQPNRHGMVCGEQIKVLTDAEGNFEVTLAADTKYRVTVQKHCFEIVTPFEPIAKIRLGILRESLGVDWQSARFSSTIEYIQNNPDKFAFTFVVEKSAVHEQKTPANLWLVHHALNKYPHVDAVDETGNTVKGTVNYLDLNNLSFEVNPPMKGKLFLN